MKQLTFDDLYFSGNIPRVHGNGFVQLDIPGSNTHRLHIWPEKKLDTQKVYTGIHNHKFSFKSKVLLGKLVHLQYEDLVRDNFNGEWNIYTTVPRDREDKGLVLATSDLFKLVNPQKFEMSAGSEYEFKAGKFHDSYGVGLTATLMNKGDVEDIQVIVTCPKDKEPDNDFNRYQFEEKILWDIIEQVFKIIKYIEV